MAEELIALSYEEEYYHSTIIAEDGEIHIVNTGLKRI